MVKHKKQHYVPKFYFRLFSEDGHNIHIFNLRKAKIFVGPFKNCATEDYFYNKNTKLEENYSSLETKFSESIRKLLKNGLSSLTEKDYFFLLMFILFQHSRTKREKVLANELTKQFTDSVMKPTFLASNIFKESGLSKSAVDELKITYPADHLFVILNSLLGVPLIHDLIPLILQNKTKKDFIFSDAPVVFYNMLLKSEKEYGTIGLQNIGLQLFCPLNKDIMLMLYDSSVYEIATENILKITEDGDIDAINSLQFFNCEDNIFFANVKKKADILELHTKLTPLSKSKQSFIIEKELIPDGKLAKRLHIYIQQFDYDMKLSFVKIKKASFDRTVRDPKLIKQHEAFIQTFIKKAEGKNSLQNR